MSRTGSPATAGAGVTRARICMLLAAAVAWTVSSAAGQQTPTPTPDSLAPPRPQAARAWLGLAFHEHLQCAIDPAEGESPCERRVVVVQVAQDGPAARAGLQPGDTLLAVAGQPVSSAADRERVLAQVLRPGRQVSVTVGRESGRTVLQLVPGTWPNRGAWISGEASPRVQVRDVPVAPEPDKHVLKVESDGRGVVWIERVPAPPSPAEGVRVEVGAMPASAVPDSARAAARAEAVRRWMEAENELLRWVELELGPELQALQDSVFRQARARLDSLRKVHPFVYRYRNAEAARVAAGARPPRAPDVRSALPLFERRVAGAEFEPLGPELAEFFAEDQGLLVLRVLPGTPADRLGLRPGDVVTEAGGDPVRELEDLRRSLAAGAEGPLLIRWTRKGETLSGTLQKR